MSTRTNETITGLAAEVSRMRRRLVAAQARGQVELHVSLDDVELLVGLSSAGIRAYRLRLDARAPGPIHTALDAVLPVLP
jgi:hypothetical protein